MKAISPVLPSSPELPEIVIAKDQPEYLPLPACIVRYADGMITVITCYQLTWRERIKLLFSGRIWWSQMTFGQALQPQAPSLTEPLADVPSEQKGVDQ